MRVTHMSACVGDSGRDRPVVAVRSFCLASVLLIRVLPSFPSLTGTKRACLGNSGRDRLVYECSPIAVFT